MVDVVEGPLDLDTLRHVPTDALALNDLGRVRLRLAEPVTVDTYADDRATGAFLLVDEHVGATLAAGMVGVAESRWAAR
jgi:sulfate adenylyltransferase subunit 1